MNHRSPATDRAASGMGIGIGAPGVAHGGLAGRRRPTL